MYENRLDHSILAGDMIFFGIEIYSFLSNRVTQQEISLPKFLMN